MSIEFEKENIMRLALNSALGALVLAVVALTPKAALAHGDEPIDGSFAVSIAAPSVVVTCSGGGIPIQAQGIGSVSGLGPLFLKIMKCLTFPGGAPVGTYAGTTEMTVSNGDTLKATYEGTQDFSMVDGDGFGPFQGTLTFTGGTGRFSHASGVLSFTAISSGSVNDAKANGQAYYLVQGTMKH